MLKKILIVLAVIVIVFLVVVAMQPSEFSVERSATIDAPPEIVFTQVADFHKWEAWSPWAKKDPNAKNTFEGPASGEGAVFKWAGNSDVGVGMMTLVESDPPERVRIKLDFEEPMAGTSDVVFAFRPQGEQTNVTWTMSGTNNFIGKAMCMFMDMDEMVGGDFEKGLASLKSQAENATRRVQTMDESSPPSVEQTPAASEVAPPAPPVEQPAPATE